MTIIKGILHLPGQLRAISRHPLNRERKARAIWRWLRWQVGSRLSLGPTIVPFIGATSLVARSGETGITANIYYGLAEYEDMGFVLHLLRPTDVFVDIGANAGVYTVLASGVVGARTEAFEPAPETVDRLKLNIRVNAIEHLVRVHQVALGARPGFVEFALDEDATNHVASNAESGAEIPMDTLDNRLGDISPAMIKMDVEGYEAMVIAGAQRTLGAPGLLSVIVETNGSGARYGVRDEEVLATLMAAGFTRVRYDPENRDIAYADQHDGSIVNSIFVRDHDEIRSRLKDSTICVAQ